MAMTQALGNVTKVRGALIFEGNPLQYYESAFVRPDADPERTSG